MARIQKNKVQSIAKRRIASLEILAQKTKNSALATRYVQLARRIAMKAKLRFPRSFKRQFCKHCYTFWRFGSTARVRLQKNKKVVITCSHCKKQTRFPYQQRPS